jgi:hypothetical protein
MSFERGMVDAVGLVTRGLVLAAHGSRGAWFTRGMVHAGHHSRHDKRHDGYAEGVR